MVKKEKKNKTYQRRQNHPVRRPQHAVQPAPGVEAQRDEAQGHQPCYERAGDDVGLEGPSRVAGVGRGAPA